MDRIRYINVRGDFESSGLWDDISCAEIDPQELNLPDDFVKRLDRLVKDYDKLIAMPEEELLSPDKQQGISELDTRGVKLTMEIANFVGDKFRLRYYSEGLRKFIEAAGK